jgi:hypothetical protein
VAGPRLQPGRLTNPVFSLPGISVRDPAAVWRHGSCHLYYTRHIGDWGGSASWDIGLTTTPDFRRFSEEIVITPPGYASPGSVVWIAGRWVMPLQSYPWPSAIALIFSDDLTHWSEPRHIVPADTGPGWGAEHGPIDGWLFRHDGRWHCAWVNFLADTDHRAFGVSASEDLETWENLTPEAPFIDGSAHNDNGGVENCAILRDGDTWHFFASVGMSPQRLAHVASDAPLTWPPLTPAAEIALRADPWCAHSQSALFVDDWREVCGKYAMIYHGLATPDGLAGFGLAFSEDLWHWTPLPFANH